MNWDEGAQSREIRQEAVMQTRWWERWTAVWAVKLSRDALEKAVQRTASHSGLCKQADSGAKPGSPLTSRISWLTYLLSVYSLIHELHLRVCIIFAVFAVVV